MREHYFIFFYFLFGVIDARRACLNKIYEHAKTAKLESIVYSIEMFVRTDNELIQVQSRKILENSRKVPPRGKHQQQQKGLMNPKHECDLS